MGLEVTRPCTFFKMSIDEDSGDNALVSIWKMKARRHCKHFQAGFALKCI